MPAVLIEKMTLKNFRGFADLTLVGMRRINFILGPNGSGKTALMEGVFLAASNGPQNALSLRDFRGLPPLTAPLNIAAFSALWEDLFYRFQTGKVSELSLSGKIDGQDFTRGLKMGEITGGEITVPLEMRHDERMPVTAEAGLRQIFFEWHDERSGRSSTQKIIPALTPFALQMNTTSDFINAFFLPARWRFNGAQAAEHFTHLVREARERDFVDIMKKVSNEIESIVVGYDQNAGQLLVKPRGLERRISASLLSDGLARVAEILLIISRYGGGVALIDEVENGIHFERYGEVIEAIDEFSSTFGTQVFFTTHSDAMLDAFHEKVAAKTEDFSIIRCSREENGGTNASLINDIWAKRALESGIELRA